MAEFHLREEKVSVRDDNYNYLYEDKYLCHEIDLLKKTIVFNSVIFSSNITKLIGHLLPEVIFLSKFQALGLKMLAK